MANSKYTERPNGVSKTMKKTWITMTILALLAMSLFSCDIEFDPASYIDRTRILGIRVDPIEAAPGEEITFSALVVDKGGDVVDYPVFFSVVGSDLRDADPGNDLPSDMETSFLKPAGTESITWTIPAQDQLESLFGTPQESGYLLTLAVGAFTNAEGNGDPLVGFKSFVISERSEEERRQNPVLEEIRVYAGGQRVNPDGQGMHNVAGTRVTLRAVPQDPEGVVSYHWFATEEEFSANLDDTEVLQAGSKGLYTAVCVMRQSYFFENDYGGRTQIAGMDWKVISIDFQ